MEAGSSRSRSRPLTSCSILATRTAYGSIAPALDSQPLQAQNVSFVTTPGQFASARCSLPGPLSPPADSGRIHRDLDALHEKIARLESRLGKNPPPAKAPSLVVVSVSQEQREPAKTTRNKFEDEFKQLMESGGKLNVRALVSTARSASAERGRRLLECSLAQSTRNNYCSVPHTTESAAPLAERNMNEGDGNADKEMMQKRMIDKSEEEEQQETNTRTIMRQTKHEVLMQLTESLEAERRKNREFQKEIELWKRRAGTAERKYEELKCVYDELAGNYMASEKIRRQQKVLIKDLKENVMVEQYMDVDANLKLSSRAGARPGTKQKQHRDENCSTMRGDEGCGHKTVARHSECKRAKSRLGTEVLAPTTNMRSKLGWR